MNADDRLDRETDPELSGLFDALETLAEPPLDPSLRLSQIQQAATTARRASESATESLGWSWRRAVSWQVAAAAAATIAIVAGLGADDRLPAPAQRVVSSVAEVAGFEVPDGSTRTGHDDHVENVESTDGTSGRSGTSPATPADPGDKGEPATPATPAQPGQGGNDDARPGTPAAPGQPETPTTPPTRSEQPDESEKPEKSGGRWSPPNGEDEDGEDHEDDEDD